MTLSLAGLLASPDWVQARETLSLDGVWDFATDPSNRGENEKWFRPGAKLPAMPLPGYAPEANVKIRVPGVWDAQGYGTETDKVHHDFVGKGWYKRQVEIPRSWAGRRVFLVVSGVQRYAKAWIDGQFLGEHIGSLSAFEYDVTKQVAPGRAATVAIQVDSKQRWEVDPLWGACTSLGSYVDLSWGGIYGHVSLEARSDAWLSDLYIRPSVSDSSCTISAALNGQTDLPDGLKVEAFDKGGQRVAEAAVKLAPKTSAGQPVSMRIALPGAALWSPDSPMLYTARLSLLQRGEVIDALKMAG